MSKKKRSLKKSKCTRDAITIDKVIPLINPSSANDPRCPNSNCYIPIRTQQPPCQPCSVKCEPCPEPCCPIVCEPRCPIVCEPCCNPCDTYKVEIVEPVCSVSPCPVIVTECIQTNLCGDCTEPINVTVSQECPPSPCLTTPCPSPCTQPVMQPVFPGLHAYSPSVNIPCCNMNYDDVGIPAEQVCVNGTTAYVLEKPVLRRRTNNARDYLTEEYPVVISSECIQPQSVTTATGVIISNE
jgi:hypothetical protein